MGDSTEEPYRSAKITGQAAEAAFVPTTSRDREEEASNAWHDGCSR